jgi:hypothetical protein
LRGPKGEAIGGTSRTTAAFTLAPDFEALEMLEPLVGGEVASSNKFNRRQTKSFDITLRWKPYPRADRYRVVVRTQADASKAVFERQVVSPELIFNKDRVYSGQIYYEVSAPLSSGFIAHSLLKPFLFTFLAPVPASPPNHMQITHDELVEEGETILITWQKTNFTEWYEIEVAKDQEFKEVVQTQKLTENFVVFKPPGISKYFWHVRSSSKSIVSPFSKISDLEVLK